MNCEQFQNQYLMHLDGPGRDMPPDLEQHLQQCGDCRRFVGILNMLGQTPAPPVSLDRKVLAGFRMIHRRNRWHRLAAAPALALAAALLIFCGLAVLIAPDAKKTAPVLAPVAAVQKPLQQDWEKQLTETEREMENLELEMSFLLTGI